MNSHHFQESVTSGSYLVELPLFKNLRGIATLTFSDPAYGYSVLELDENDLEKLWQILRFAEDAIRSHNRSVGRIP